MRWLLFLSRVALVCNIFFLLAFSLKLKDWIGNEQISSTVIIIGFVLGLLFNPLVNICYLVLFFVKKNKLSIIPPLIIVLNILFLFAQLLFLFMLNIEHNTPG